MRVSGGSVASARLASESMIMLTHSICKAAEHHVNFTGMKDQAGVASTENLSIKDGRHGSSWLEHSTCLHSGPTLTTARQRGNQFERRACTAVSGDSVATIAPVTAVATATRLMVSWNCRGKITVA